MVQLVSLDVHQVLVVNQPFIFYILLGFQSIECCVSYRAFEVKTAVLLGARLPSRELLAVTCDLSITVQDGRGTLVLLVERQVAPRGLVLVAFVGHGLGDGF